MKYLSFVVIFSMCSQGSNNKNYYNEIIYYSDEYHVDPILVLSVIRIEENNQSITDYAQDKLLIKLLNLKKTGKWWEQWIARFDSISSQELISRATYNKWSVDLYQSGYISSYGIGQITPRTLIKACNYYNNLPSPCRCSRIELFNNLLIPEKSIELIAFILKYEKDFWNYKNGDKDQNIDYSFHLTLYNYGVDLYSLKFDTMNIDSRFSKRFLNSRDSYFLELEKKQIFLK